MKSQRCEWCKKPIKVKNERNLCGYCDQFPCSCVMHYETKITDKIEQETKLSDKQFAQKYQVVKS